jgi:hypothetical protein
MLYKIRRTVNYLHFNHLVRDIHDTAPLKIEDSQLRILSMVAIPRDIPMYLMAAKLLYKRLGHGRFLMLPDAPISPSWRDRIMRHLGGGVEFLDLSAIPVGRCQRGGCWERLLACVDHSTQHYVIQMDSDTLAFRDLPEVAEAVRSNRAFTLGNGIPRQTLTEAAAWIATDRSASTHINDVAQAAFTRYPNADGLYYIRGSAGFAGFAAGAVGRAMVEDFHATMEGLVGTQRWREWGTEQLASNFIIANSPDPLVLPHPRYSTVPRGADMSEVAFGHFIATGRFVGQRMAKAGRALIRNELMHAG